MTLTAVAQQIFDAAQSGSLETLDGPLEILSGTLTQDLGTEELGGAQRILEDARTALYVRRSHIVRALQQNRRGSLYGGDIATRNSWEFSG